MTQAKFYDVIRTPVVTEKSTRLGEYNKYTFKVSSTATKKLVKEAVEAVFSVKVTGVNTVTVPGKERRFRGRVGYRSGYKKAIVTLAAGQSINFTAGA